MNLIEAIKITKKEIKQTAEKSKKVQKVKNVPETQDKKSFKEILKKKTEQKK